MNERLTKNMSKVSIIIPVYNVKRYLRQCLDSVLAQTFEDWECLVIDDGSTDGSGMICDEYAAKDARFRVFHKRNGGVSSARNTGLDNARGEWISFIDSDDWVETNYLKIFLEKCKDYDLVFFTSANHSSDGCVVVYSAGNYEGVLRKEVEEEIGRLLDNRLGYNFFGYTWNKFFRSQIIKAGHIRFIEGLSVSEDEVFTHEYARAIHSIKYIEDPLYHYRLVSDGLTGRIKSIYEIKTLCQQLQKICLYYTNQDVIHTLECRILDSMWQVFLAERNPFNGVKILAAIYRKIMLYDVHSRFFCQLIHNLLQKWRRRL